MTARVPDLALTSPPLYGDLRALADHLLPLDRGDRFSAGMRIIRRAEAAQQHRRSTGRAHPEYGNGSIMGAVTRAAGGHPAAGDLRDAEYCNAVLVAAGCLECLARSGRLSAENAA